MERIKDFKKAIYQLYEEDLKSGVFEEEYKSEKIEIGGLYIGNLNNQKLIFVVVDEIGSGWFECFKVSHFWELGTINDILYRDYTLGNLIIETDINFYLKDKEIKQFKKIDKLDREFIERLLNYREMNTKDKLEYKELEKGLYYPLGNEWVRKFKDKEFELVYDYHLRIFAILDELE